MDESGKGDIPFIKGRRVGPDAIISRDEQWAARSREANPQATSWYISTGTPADAGNLAITSALNEDFLIIAPAIPLTGVLDISVARLTVNTGDAGEHFRTCLYKYVGHRDLRKRSLLKVRHTDVVFDVSTDTKSDIPPHEIDLAESVRLYPSEIYFIGYRPSDKATMRLPLFPGNDMSPFFQYFDTSETTGTFPDKLVIADLGQNHNLFMPWVTYLSKEASILFK